MSARLLLLMIAVGLMGGSLAPATAAMEDDADPDVVYVARMEPVLVIGYRIDETYTGGLATAGRTGGRLLASATRGGRTTTRVDTEEVAPNGIGIGGFVADETFSVVGARFSRAFHSKWKEPAGTANYGYTIHLKENPVPRFGAQVIVEIEGRTIFRAYLRPNRRQIQRAAKRAVQRATLYLKEYYEPRDVY